MLNLYLAPPPPKKKILDLSESPLWATPLKIFLELDYTFEMHPRPRKQRLIF